MYFNAIKRRHFLQAAGGAMSLPLLPSLTPSAFAAAAERKCFITIAEPHGGYNVEQLYPTRMPAGEEILYSGSASSGMDHRIRKEALRNFIADNNDELSPILGRFLNPYLDKINILRGLDIMFYLGHHEGAYLGNFAARHEPGVPQQMTQIETIDQVMARSSQFYNSAPVLPIINIASNHSISYARISGRIEAVNTQENWRLFNIVTGSSQANSTPSELTRYLNSIYSDYDNLVNGAYGAARRLSAADRQRLEEHMTLITELRGKLDAQNGVAGACNGSLDGATDDEVVYWPPDISQAQKQAKWENTLNLIAGAIKCGVSRIVNIPVNIHPAFAGDWHGVVAHREQGDSNAETLRLTAENYRFTAQYIFKRLIEKLNVDRGDGQSYIDQSLVMWIHECGPITHDPVEMAVITAGSAGGFFDTGNYVDYRNLSNLGVSGEGRAQQRRPGLPYSRWLYTALKSMGIPDSDFARDGMVGYGDPYVDRSQGWFANFNNHTAWPTRVTNDMGRLMPRIIT